MGDFMLSKFIVKIRENCVACGTCEKVCPREAIKIVKEIKAFVNENLCVGCGLCANSCPAGIIDKIERGKNG